jgi:iron complex outermembrane receptor protein
MSVWSVRVGARSAALWFAVSVSTLAALLVPMHARAQHTTVRGLVVAGADGGVVAGVLVLLDSGQQARTDAAGAFALTGVPAGPHRVALVAPGCQIAFASVGPVHGDDRVVAFQIDYDAEVVAEAHRRAASARVIGAAEIANLHARDLTDVLSRLVPGLVSTASSQPGQDVPLRSRGQISVHGPVPPAVVLDGMLMGEAGVARIDDIAPNDVAWIEVARGAAGGWEVGTGGAGGVIRIQTKGGRRMDAAFVDPARCWIPGWGEGAGG